MIARSVLRLKTIMEQNLAPTFRKRTISDGSALNRSKLGEMSRSPKRSLRYSTNASGSRSDETLTQDASEFVDEIPNFERKWHSTGLGTKYESKEYKVRPQDMVLTVMNYNVLADYLAKRHPELYNQVGIEAEHLDWSTRFDRIINEIKKYHCDVLCLQEVQDEHFYSHFEPALRELGYGSLFKKRTGDKKDGCAIFYKASKVIFLIHNVKITV